MTRNTAQGVQHARTEGLFADAVAGEFEVIYDFGQHGGPFFGITIGVRSGSEDHRLRSPCKYSNEQSNDVPFHRFSLQDSCIYS